MTMTEITTREWNEKMLASEINKSKPVMYEFVSGKIVRQATHDEFVKSQKIAFSKSVHNTSYGVGMFVSDGIEVIVLG